MYFASSPVRQWFSFTYIPWVTRTVDQSFQHKPRLISLSRMGLFRAVRVEVDLGCHSFSIKVTPALSARGFSTPWLVQKDSFMLNIPGWSDRVGKIWPDLDQCPSVTLSVLREANKMRDTVCQIQLTYMIAAAKISLLRYLQQKNRYNLTSPTCYQQPW